MEAREASVEAREASVEATEAESEGCLSQFIRFDPNLLNWAGHSSLFAPCDQKVRNALANSIGLTQTYENSRDILHFLLPATKK